MFRWGAVAAQRELDLSRGAIRALGLVVALAVCLGLTLMVRATASALEIVLLDSSVVVAMLVALEAPRTLAPVVITGLILSLVWTAAQFLLTAAADADNTRAGYAVEHSRFGILIVPWRATPAVIIPRGAVPTRNLAHVDRRCVLLLGVNDQGFRRLRGRHGGRARQGRSVSDACRQARPADVQVMPDTARCRWPPAS